MPIFNQEENIVDTIWNLVSCLTLPCELIFIDDASNDETYQRLLEVSNQVMASQNSAVSLKILRNPCEKFETHCDMQGVQVAQAPYVIEIQADMNLHEKGFDLKLVEALESDSRLIMLSGRATDKLDGILTHYGNTPGAVSSRGRSLASHIFHDFLDLLKFLRVSLSRKAAKDDILTVEADLSPLSETHFLMNGQRGKLGAAAEDKFTEIELNQRKIYWGETVMRGPLIFNKERFLDIGGFSVQQFFLGFDEHDFVIRAWIHFGLRVGFVPIGYQSNLKQGSTRRAKSLKTRALYTFRLSQIQFARKNSSIYKASLVPVDLPKNKITEF